MICPTIRPTCQALFILYQDKVDFARYPCIFYIFSVFFNFFEIFQDFLFFFKKGLTNQNKCGIILRSQKSDDLGVAQLVARYLGVVEAASSSLVTQTKRRFLGISVFLCFWGVFPFFCVSKLLTMLEKRGNENAVFYDCYPKLLPKLFPFPILPFCKQDVFDSTTK